MSSTVRRSLSSEPFEILAKSGKRFFVHGDILTAQSEPLRSLTTGVWKEATEKKIDLSDWDDKTVGRLVEYLYFEDYHISGQVTEGEGGERGLLNKLGTAWSPVGLEGLGVGKVNILLEHAEVYTLAQYKAIEGLKAMALERLRMALENMNKPRPIEACGASATVPTMANVPELLEHVYSNTDSLTSSDEPMRDLVSTFAAKHFEKLMDESIMEILVRERCDFAFELMKKVSERLKDEGAKLREMEGNVDYWRIKAEKSKRRTRE